MPATPTTLDLARYERYGWHYDALTAGQFRPGEAEFYRHWAQRGAGPVCEPACGAARVLAALYRSGLECWGADPSPAMLALAEHRLAEQAAPPRTPAVRLVRQAVQDFAFETAFGLVMLPLEAFRLLRTPAEQRAFLTMVRRHLRPGGALALDVTLPEATLPSFAGPFLAHHEQLGTVSATARWRRTAELTVEETLFETRGPDGQVFREVVSDAYRVVTAAELDELLVATGWRAVLRWADHTGTPYRPGEGRLVCVAKPGEA